LFDHLSGKAYDRSYHPPGTSGKPEQGKVPAPGLRIHINVVPGQEAQTRLETLDDLFDSKKTIDGLVHVVANGFSEIRNPTARKVQVEKGIDSIQKFRESQQKLELDDLIDMCKTVRSSIRKSKKPRWMLVAVTKADLYATEDAWHEA